VEEARALFVDLARSMVLELSKGASSTTGTAAANGTADATANGANGNNNDDNAAVEDIKAAQAHARRVLADDEAGNTIDRVAGKLLFMADLDGDERINLPELAQLFETVFEANIGTATVEDDDDDGNDDDGDDLNNNKQASIDGTSRVPSGTFPQPLRALAGSLQLLPPRERAFAAEAAERSALWNVGVPGDDHTLRRVILEDGSSKDRGGSDDSGRSKKKKKKKQKKKQQSSNTLSLVGLGRSADASAYFLPELGIALDAGLHVSSLRPKTVLLTHGHRDHIGALPVHASHDALLLVPRPIRKLVHNFLVAEAQLNYGDASQREEQTLEALGGRGSISWVRPME